MLNLFNESAGVDMHTKAASLLRIAAGELSEIADEPDYDAALSALD